MVMVILTLRKFGLFIRKIKQLRDKQKTGCYVVITDVPEGHKWIPKVWVAVRGSPEGPGL